MRVRGQTGDLAGWGCMVSQVALFGQVSSGERWHFVGPTGAMAVNPGAWDGPFIEEWSVPRKYPYDWTN